MERAGAGKGKGCEAAHQPSPGEVLLDEFLGKQGLYRKKIAKDGSCLFRAVAEQVFHTQSKHLDVRGECVSYLRRNRELFEAFIEGSFDEHLNKLEKPQEWVGQVEISALSLMYKRDFIIYQEPNRPPARVTENGFSDTISLCFSNGNHYDSVYPRKFVDAAALCQSILYETLYQNVFKADVEAVKSALDTNSKVNNAHLSCSEDSDSDAEMEKPRGKADDESDVNGSKSQSCNKVRKKQEKKNESAVLLSFPGEVLRALNPNIYRNIEYEVWQKSKQAQQKRDYSIAAGMQYVVGDKCKVCLDDGKCYNAHIQAVSPDNGPVDVYIEELGEKHSALLQNLRPLTQVSQRGTWSKVQGKRAKKPMNVNSEADFTGVKNSSSFINKPNRLQSNLPPRRHQAMAARQQSSPLQTTDHQSKVASPKYVERAEDFPQLSKKYDRSPDFDPTSIQCTAIGSSGKIELGMNEPQTSTNIQLKIDKSQSAFDNPLEKTSQIGTEQIDPVLELDLQMPHSSSSGSSVTSPVIPIYLSSQTVENSSQISSTSPSSVTVSDAPMTSVWIKPPYAPFPGANFPPLLAPFIPSIYDVLYPGFPLNERGEFPTSAPLYSYDKSGADLPDDKSILRFFYNLGVQAYSFQWWPPYSYLYPLNQAYWKHCGMYPGCPPIFYANPQFQTMAGNVQNDIDGAPLHTPHPPRINTTNQSDVGDEDNLPLSAQAAAKHLSHKNKSVPVSPNPVQPPQNFNSLSPSRLPHLASDGTPQPHSGWEAPPPKSSITQNVLARPLNSHPMDMTVPGHVYPLQINDGTCVRPVDQKIGVNSGREAPPPKSSITQNVLARPLNSHPMDMTVPGHVYPLQINDGTCVRPVDQKIGVNSGREAPPPKSSITQNVLARPLNSHPMDMTVPGHVYPLQINDGTCVRPVDQKIGVNSGREAPPPKSSITQNVLPLISKSVDAIRNSCSSDVKQQSVQSPCEECAKQHSILKKEMKPEKANLISAAGLSSLDTKNNGPQNIAEEHASNSEIDCACSEGNFKSGLASQSIGESKVDIVEQSTAVTSKNKDLMNNYKMPSTKPAHSYKQTSREMSYHVKNGPSERNVLRCSPYIHKKGERQVSRKNKQGNPWSSRNTSCLHDSNIDRTGETVTKGNNKPLIKNRIVRRSEMHIGFGGHENLQIRVENERHHMNENTLHEEPCFVNRSDDMQQFQVMENTSGAPFEGKRNSFRKQRYTSNEKSNTYARK